MLTAPKVTMLRLQPTRRCNLNCSYCYIPAAQRLRADLMSQEVLETTLRRLVDEALLEDLRVKVGVPAQTWKNQPANTSCGY